MLGGALTSTSSPTFLAAPQQSSIPSFSATTPTIQQPTSSTSHSSIAPPQQPPSTLWQPWTAPTASSLIRRPPHPPSTSAAPHQSMQDRRLKRGNLHQIIEYYLCLLKFDKIF